MTIRNPFSTDGTFSAVDRFAALNEELQRSKPILEGWVRAGRMRRENFEAKIGALEAVLEDLREEMIREAAKSPACVWVGPKEAITCRTCGIAFDYSDRVAPSCPRKAEAAR